MSSKRRVKKRCDSSSPRKVWEEQEIEVEVHVQRAPGPSNLTLSFIVVPEKKEMDIKVCLVNIPTNFSFILFLSRMTTIQQEKGRN